MKTIRTSKGRLASVDDEDFERLAQFKWYEHSNSSRDFRPARRTTVAEGRKVVFMHQEVLGQKLGMVIDHINGDPFDNRRCNLRHCTNAENLRNRSRHRGSKMSFKGIVRSRNCFEARIGFEGKQRYIGHYKTEEDAARAYDKAARELHGEFARTNFTA